MQNERVTKAEIKLIGLCARTNNQSEMDPTTARIPGIIGKFSSEGIANYIPQRKHPGVALSVYTDYESDEHGDYTYFFGEEVDSFDHCPAELQQLTIPASPYQKFITPVGKMPYVVINAWQQIWKMTAQDFGGNRAYIADFELYDQRASDPTATSLDIFIGVR